MPGEGALYGHGKLLFMVDQEPRGAAWILEPGRSLSVGSIVLSHEERLVRTGVQLND